MAGSVLAGELMLRVKADMGGECVISSRGEGAPSCSQVCSQAGGRTHTSTDADGQNAQLSGSL
jgi:hypothetical protein